MAAGVPISCRLTRRSSVPLGRFGQTSEPSEDCVPLTPRWSALTFTSSPAQMSAYDAKTKWGLFRLILYFIHLRNTLTSGLR